MVETVSVKDHYDLLIDENNDPVCDPPELKSYMDGWDGEPFINLLELSKSKSCLEIGCGTGRLALRVAPLVLEYHGIDLSSKTVERARQNLKGLRVKLFEGDFLDFDFLGSYDIIFSSLTFMHIKDKAVAIKKIYKLLKPNGKAVLSLDKATDKFIDYGTRFIEVYPDDNQLIAELFAKTGFKNIEIAEAEHAFIVSGKRD